MPDLIVIRLAPQKPTDGATFAGALKGLSITVNDMSFQNPSGESNPIGSAFYDPSDPASTIVQHVMPPPSPAGILAAVATALIVLDPAKRPPAYKEYISSDLRLSITRGKQTIIDQSLNYNVLIDIDGTIPLNRHPVLYAGLGPVALYLSLPEAGVGVDPDRAFVDAPADGSVPNYNELLANVTKVLEQDPGAGLYDIAALTPAQCLHIAREIGWNRNLIPSPVPPGILEDLYTLPDAASLENDRKRFESDLTSYYTANNAKADVLANYIFALSAAHACEKKTIDVKQVSLELPVLPGIDRAGGKTVTINVILS